MQENLQKGDCCPGDQVKYFKKVKVIMLNAAYGSRRIKTKHWI